MEALFIECMHEQPRLPGQSPCSESRGMVERPAQGPKYKWIVSLTPNVGLTCREVVRSDAVSTNMKLLATYTFLSEVPQQRLRRREEASQLRMEDSWCELYPSKAITQPLQQRELLSARAAVSCQQRAQQMVQGEQNPITDLQVMSDVLDRILPTSQSLCSCQCQLATLTIARLSSMIRVSSSWKEATICWA